MDQVDHFGHIAFAAGKTQTSFFVRNPDGSYGPRAFGSLDPEIVIPWGGTAAEQAAAMDARYGKGAGAMVGTGNGEGWVDVTPALRAHGVAYATNTDEEDARMIVGAAEFVQSFAGPGGPAVPVGTPPAPPAPPPPAATQTPTTSPASPIATHPVVVAAAPDAHAAANAFWMQQWTALRPALIVTHGVVVAPAVRQAILASEYPLLVAAAQAGLVGADGKLAG
jgi:hypothetical protein